MQIVKPEVIELFVDTMVMNNDDALKREDVEPTYKPVKGFQPLHVTWADMIIDLIFAREVHTLIMGLIIFRYK